MTAEAVPQDRALTSPSALRNRGPILDVLRTVLPERAEVLEIASGSGEHAVWFCKALPLVRWQPSDRDPAAVDSIAAWRKQAGLPNLLAPVLLDAASPAAWPRVRVDAVVAINMIHISAWESTLGMVQGSAAVLREGGVLMLYGAFREAGVPLTQSNLAFDEDLKARNPAWGLRELDAVVAEAERVGLALIGRVEMPANNLALTFGSKHSFLQKGPKNLSPV